MMNSDARQHYCGCGQPFTSPMGNTTFDLIANIYPLLEEMVFGSTLSRSRRIFAQRVTEGNNILHGPILYNMVAA
jgi:hypothetical protein